MPSIPWAGLPGNASIPQHARSAYALVSYEGSEINLSQYVESLQYTDNASGALDDISITLDNRDGIPWTPEKEKDMDVWIYMTDWYQEQRLERYHCGNFVIDDISIEGEPKTVTVKGIAAPASRSFKDVPVTNTWQQIGLKSVAEYIMAKYGMGNLYFNVDDVLVETMEQDAKSDSEFLTEICRKYGLSCKAYKTGLVIFSEAVYEAGEPYKKFGDYPPNWQAMAEDWTVHEIRPDWKWNSTLQGTYTGAEISYTNGGKGETLKATVGEGTRMLYLNEKADSLAEAERIAKERVNEENKKAVTFSFGPTLFDPGLFASYCVEIVNMDPRIVGKYYVDKVSVSLSGDGLSMDCDCHKVFPRL